MALFRRPPITVRDQHLPRRVPIDGYGDRGFNFAEMSHPGSLLCLPSGIYGWSPDAAAEIDVEALRPVFEEAGEIDVLLIGCGRDIAAIPMELRRAVREAGMGLEVMATPPAIRTYNILLDEGRPVAAALIAIHPDR